jgi:hypothetical protein
MATLAELLRQSADKLINLPSEAQRFITNPQAFTQLLTGKNPLPRETGFAAGVTGLPATEMSVLDPNQAPYMQGYGQGEPVGYAGMALPFAAPATVAGAKALAPKAGQAIEGYMVNQGLLQPLTAYHGTPHNIQGKFDITKVGTGEGNQSFGYGMYFAENPAVATQYRDALSDFDWKFNGKPYDINNPAHRAAIELKQLGGDSARAETIKRYEKNIADLESRDVDWAKSAAQKKKEELEVLKTGVLPQLEETSKGNLYKVDIPDADIPMMLDWDKPFSKQQKAVQDAMKQIEPKIKQTSPNLDITKMTGQDFYRAYQRYRGNYPDFASEGLSEVGIKGIRYLDEGSRVDFKYSGDSAYTNASISFKESNYTPKAALEGMKKAYKNADPKELKLAIDDVYGIQPKKTSNFVVFEPSTVKILEKNDKPVSRKEIIEKQVKAIKE